MFWMIFEIDFRTYCTTWWILIPDLCFLWMNGHDAWNDYYWEPECLHKSRKPPWKRRATIAWLSKYNNLLLEHLLRLFSCLPSFFLFYAWNFIFHRLTLCFYVLSRFRWHSAISSKSKIVPFVFQVKIFKLMQCSFHYLFLFPYLFLSISFCSFSPEV